MNPIVGNEYDIEFWDGEELYPFRARCICEQPIENGCFLFEADDDKGVEIEVDGKDIVREITRELV